MVIYLAAWVLLMWPSLVPLGRPATAMVGGALIIVLRQMSSAFRPGSIQGFDAFATIDWDPIALLFGLKSTATRGCSIGGVVTCPEGA